MGSIEPNAVYSRPEAAELLGLAVSTLANWKAQGEGPKCARPGKGKRGGVTFYRGESILEWLRSLEDAA